MELAPWASASVITITQEKIAQMLDARVTVTIEEHAFEDSVCATRLLRASNAVPHCVPRIAPAMEPATILWVAALVMMDGWVNLATFKCATPVRTDSVSTEHAAASRVGRVKAVRSGNVPTVAVDMEPAKSMVHAPAHLVGREKIVTRLPVLKDVLVKERVTRLLICARVTMALPVKNVVLSYVPITATVKMASVITGVAFVPKSGPVWTVAIEHVP
jgi:hypothetical protein